MGVLQLLSQDNFITYSKVVAKQFGVNSAILLGALCSYQNSFENQEFYKEQDKIIEDTCLSKYEIQQALKVLVNAGILKITKKGLPAKNYYFIFDDKLFKILTTSGLKIRQLEVKKLDDINNNTINNNIITNNTVNKKENILKEKVRNSKFIPPTEQEVYDYANSRGRGDLAKSFYDYYTATEWCDAKGNKVARWKGKFIVWENNNPPKQQTTKSKSAIDPSWLNKFMEGRDEEIN